MLPNDGFPHLFEPVVAISDANGLTKGMTGVVTSIVDDIVTVEFDSRKQLFIAREDFPVYFQNLKSLAASILASQL